MSCAHVPTRSQAVHDCPQVQAARSEIESSSDAPTHPVESMQGAFEESIVETARVTEVESPKALSEKVDSATRRRILLEQEEHEETHAGRWRPKLGERYHPLWKVVAQVAFGIHLLHEQLATSIDEVVNVLQTHVNEVDGFLERTVEDFDLAFNDINERIQCLKLPLDNRRVFEVMLDNKEFRTSIVNGNEKIEHIISRTTAAMRDAQRDVRHGLEATKELVEYLLQLDSAWSEGSDEQLEIYIAMRCNAEGWYRCFIGLQNKGKRLRDSLHQLEISVTATQKLAGIASRRNLGRLHTSMSSTSDVSTARQKSQSSSPAISPRFPGSPLKPLPRDPDRLSSNSSPSSSNPRRSKDLSQRRPRPRVTQWANGANTETRVSSETRHGFADTASLASLNKGGKPFSRQEFKKDGRIGSSRLTNEAQYQGSSHSPIPWSPATSSPRPTTPSSRSFNHVLPVGHGDRPKSRVSSAAPSDYAHSSNPPARVNSPNPPSSVNSSWTVHQTDLDVSYLSSRLSCLGGAGSDIVKHRDRWSLRQHDRPLTMITSDSAYASGEFASQLQSPSPKRSKMTFRSSGSQHVESSPTHPVPPPAQRLLGITTPISDQARRRSKRVWTLGFWKRTLSRTFFARTPEWTLPESGNVQELITVLPLACRPQKADPFGRGRNK